MMSAKRHLGVDAIAKVPVKKGWAKGGSLV
jgi:hypothetical protein